MDILVRHDSGMRFRATCNGFTVTAGKGQEGDIGQDGMYPGQLFIASLGMCIGAYVVRFCQRHSIQHQGMVVELGYQTGDSPSRVKTVQATIKLSGKVPEKYRKAIVRAADQCYVTQSIEHGMEVKVSLSEALLK
jgi:putative redox protein